MAVIMCLLLSLLSRSLGVVQFTTWEKLGADTKFIKSGTILATLDRSLVLCAGHCSAVFSCLAFNYQPSSRLCELLSAAPYSTSDPAMTANPGWSFYFMGLPEGDPCKNSGCPETSMCLTYEQPVALRPYDPTLPTFTCAANPWFLEQRKLGYRECRFKVQYDMHFRGSVVTNNNRNLAYYDSLQTCLQLSCLSLCCDEINNYCYLKNSFHVLNPSILRAQSGVTYWYPECI